MGDGGELEGSLGRFGLGRRCIWESHHICGCEANVALNTTRSIIRGNKEIHVMQRS